MDYATDHPADGRHWILHWTTEGKCLFLDEVPQQVGPGELVLTPPDRVCRYQRSPACGRWVHHWLRFIPDPGWIQWCPPLHRRSGLLQAALAEDLCASVDGAFNDIEKLQRSVDPRLAVNRLEFLLLLLVDAGAEDHAQLDERIQIALTVIGANFAADWTLPELAAQCYMSVPRLAGLFRKQLGVAPMQWRDQLRMQEACKLLRETNIQVAEVAREVGYDDPLHFSRRFKQLVACSPRDYRRRQ